MITIQYVDDLKGARKYCSCNSCGKSASDDSYMVQIRFTYGDGHGIAVNLCNECRRELYGRLR